MTSPAQPKVGDPLVLPYSRIVGQATLQLALEISYVEPAVGGVLATGQRGTAKSTTVRAFGRMVSGRLPVTLPIGATEDRIVGGWSVEDLVDGRTVWKAGLLEEVGGEKEPGTTDEAGGRKIPGMLYIDEVNLLEDHLVNIILDAAATGILTVQRDGVKKENVKVAFNLVGTMNPEEGSLRPQLLDRFGLVIPVRAASEANLRSQVLTEVLDFEQQVIELGGKVGALYRDDNKRYLQLENARQRLDDVAVPPGIIEIAGRIAELFDVEGHRGELAMLRAARALAAIRNSPAITPKLLAEVTPMALIHRRATSDSGRLRSWSIEDDSLLAACLGDVAPAAS
ncbi:AAA family ATPase [Paractinoplanes maris]|uniref:AAA family ATPase n=1 Tax=Paractinoplanes maris TaxID=1734446 RepID=UPI0020227DF1|nr:AAA family ATPase [Actinoplanes maris]